MEVWNLATDHVVNDLLRRRGLEVPEGAVLFSRLTGQQLSSEQVYERLKKEMGGSDSGKRALGAGRWEKGAEGDAKRALKQVGSTSIRGVGSHEAWGAKPVREASVSDLLRVDRAIETALQHSKSIGTKAGALIQALEAALTKPLLDWRKLLAEVVADALTPDPCFIKRVNPLYWQMGIGVPDTLFERRPFAIVALDSSGSVNQEEFTTFLEELHGILSASTAVAEVLVIDTQVQHHAAYDPAKTAAKHFAQSIPFRGRGGTDFTAAFAWVQDHCLSREPDILIYLTDGYGTNHAQTPGYPVVWVITHKGSGKQKFGKVIILPPGQKY